MYNEDQRYYATSVKDMLDNELVYEAIVPRSTSVLKFFDDNETDNYFLFRYINVLNGARNLRDSLYEFRQFIEEARRAKFIDKYQFHSHFKHYMSDANSVLDYLDRLFKELRRLDRRYVFNRKNDYVVSLSNSGITLYT